VLSCFQRRRWGRFSISIPVRFKRFFRRGRAVVQEGVRTQYQSRVRIDRKTDSRYVVIHIYYVLLTATLHIPFDHVHFPLNHYVLCTEV